MRMARGLARFILRIQKSPLGRWQEEPCPTNVEDHTQNQTWAATSSLGMPFGANEAPPTCPNGAPAREVPTQNAGSRCWVIRMLSEDVVMPPRLVKFSFSACTGGRMLVRLLVLS